MQEFNIKQLEQLSGIKAHTIRIWEKRYKLVAPDRTGGKHRSYTNEDLRYILRIVYLYNKGFKISKIAKLGPDEIARKINSDIEQTTRFEDLLPGLMEACIDLDEKKVRFILKKVEVEFGTEQMMLKLIYPFLEKLGSAWVTGKVLPTNEHFISHIISSTLIFAASNLKRKSKDYSRPTILLFQPEGEFHEIPLLFLNYLLMKAGNHTIYLGSNVGVDAVEAFTKVHRVTAIHFHLVTTLTQVDAQQYFDDLAQKFSPTPIVSSGMAAMGLLSNYLNQVILRDEDEMMRYVNQSYVPGAEE